MTRVQRSARRRTQLVTLTIGFAVALGTFSDSRIRAAAQGPQPASGSISAAAAAQMGALIREKQSRTPIQRKIDSQLLYQLKMQRGQAIAAGVVRLDTGLSYELDGQVTLDVRAAVSDGLLARLTGFGAELIDVQPAYSSIRLRISLLQIESIAAIPEVSWVQPKAEWITSRLQPALIRQQEGITNVGSRNSEGDATHRAAFARTTDGVDGSGVKIGVLSNGVANLAASQAAGDLGPVTVLPGQTGSGDEGTAMLEIIHDLAPGAQLYFATGSTSLASFASNIRALRTAGCDVIVDDVFYLVESPFQDGQTGTSQYNSGAIAQAVKDVAASGALYFSAAGNEGNLTSGTSGTWEGDFTDGGPIPAVLDAGYGGCPGCRVHSFGPQTYDVLNASGVAVTLNWADPLGGSTNDYDLFRLDSTGTSVLAFSANDQSGTQDPIEVMSPGSAGNRIVIVKYGGAGRFLQLTTARGRLSIATAGETHGHAAVSAPTAFGVAATPAPAAYPNPFGPTNVIESFSSDGPRRIFFNGNGSPSTPGNFTSTGGIVLNKPDITAADGVSVTGVGGFGSPFYGTSAAAPHAGAIAALVKSRNLSLTATQVRTALINTAIDIMLPGSDRDSGAGIIMADSAVGSVACGFGISPTSASFSASGATGTVAVTAFGCSWTAVSNAGFISVTGGSSGTGNGNVSFLVSANTGAPNITTAPRSGTITIAEQTFTVNQTGCSFSITPMAATFGSAAAPGAVNIIADSACSWTASGLPAWAATTSGGSGTGPGTWQYSVAPNGTGSTRSQAIPVAGQSFTLRQLGVSLQTTVPGRSTLFTLANAADAHSVSIEAVEGNSYCAQLAPGPTAVLQATPALSVFRADDATPLGRTGPSGTCFIAPATETTLIRATQTDLGARPYKLRVTQTTMWANWFFIGAGYSSFTLLTNTTGAQVNAEVTWRSDLGAVVGTQTVAVPARTTVARDAKTFVSGAIAGSVAVAHDGEPEALVGSQTTLSGGTGLSFDTLFFRRFPW